MRISSIKVVICRTCRSVEADVRGEIADVHTSNCTRHKIYVYIKEGILKVHNNYINMSESESASLENQEWLCSVKPSKTIYFPQIGDHVVYVKQAHHDYLEEVKKRNLYRVEESDKPWSSMNFRELDVHEYVKVVEIKYVMQPLRLCCLKLELLSDKTSFTVRYRNLDRVTDFLVLRQIFDAACKRKWRSGHRLRRLIGKVWFYGQIISVQDYHHRRYPGSQYKRLRVEWNNGRLEEISPWEVEEISKSTHRLERDEWTYDTAIGDSVRCRILHGLGPLMKLDIAKPFLKLNGDLSYFSTANYPIDLQTIHDRLQNRFYRRVAAIRFDVEMLAVNIRELRERPVVILSFSMENNIFVICDAVTTKLLRIIEDANQNEASQSQTSTSQGAVGREPDRRATDGNDESDDNLSLADTVVESPRKRRRVCANREGTSSIIIRQSKTKSCEEIVINLPRRSSAKGKETRNYRSKNSGKRIIVCIVDNYEDKSEEDEDGEEDDSGDDQSDSTDDENAQENERTMNINRGRTNFPGIRAATTGGSQRRKCWTTESRFYDSEVQAGAKRRGRGHGTSRCNQFKADMALNTGNDVRAIKEMIQAAKNDLYKCLTETQHKLDCILQVVDTCLQQTTVNDQGVQTEPNEEPVQQQQVTLPVGIPMTANNFYESNSVTIGNNNCAQNLDQRIAVEQGEWLIHQTQLFGMPNIAESDIEQQRVVSTNSSEPQEHLHTNDFNQSNPSYNRICSTSDESSDRSLYTTTFHSTSDSEFEVEEDDINRPSTSTQWPTRPAFSLRLKTHKVRKDWQVACQKLLDTLWQCEDSIPFREPVDLLEHPEYLRFISTPMDLRTVKEELLGGNYKSPSEFAKDMKLIFTNSRRYNTDTRSKIYFMTLRLSATFEKYMCKIMDNWKSANRRKTNSESKKSKKGSPTKSQLSNEVSKKSPTKRKAVSSEEEDDDNDETDDNEDHPMKHYEEGEEYNEARHPKNRR
ncbi:bromodomain and WD repeat-containing protein 1-like isoform X4 [Nasonia vitripennis]|uniref:Bromo domain-containing protein n=1 Tax=Nasonia vitripennis TaxID=7425 RepID=A0A7M7IRD6_NASVI|nr:bromodomain and WD repeat-containing protein 1-like isoform X4 [Nasonia vitripennis]XP_016840177.1 bromodomain and WD repeat-containing protein 1-like isoform X4 [Nasonia vitripennis]